MSERERLAGEIAREEKRRASMLAANEIIRARGQTAEQKTLRLCRECGLSVPSAEALLVPDAGGRIGYSKFAIEECGRKIRRFERWRKMLEPPPQAE